MLTLEKLYSTKHLNKRYYFQVKTNRRCHQNDYEKTSYNIFVFAIID